MQGQLITDCDAYAGADGIVIGDADLGMEGEVMVGAVAEATLVAFHACGQFIENAFCHGVGFLAVAVGAALAFLCHQNIDTFIHTH